MSAVTQREIRSYPQILAIGHRFIEDILDGPVLVQEKIDGSQVSWGTRDGDIFFRSKGRMIDPLDPQMFDKFVASVLGMLVIPSDDDGPATMHRPAEVFPEGWTFRAEYLMRPKHNTITYGRTPEGYLVLFDIDRGEQDYLQPYVGDDLPNVISDPLAEWADKLGIESARMLHYGNITEDELHYFINQGVTSTLSGEETVLAEGIVVKNYNKLGPDKKIMIGKLVDPKFKERNKVTHKVTTRNDIIDALIANFNQEARWEKAIQRRRDAGELLNAPQDIGPLIKDLNADLSKEEETEIAEALVKHAMPKILRGLNSGFAEWFKQGLDEGRWRG